jgi:HlyD family secretion protein
LSVSSIRPARFAALRRALAAVAIPILVALSSCGHDSDQVRGSGTIEMDEIDVSSLVGGRIAHMKVVEGDTVRAGDTLAVLERGELRADLMAQTAEAGRATAQLRDLQAGPRRQEIEAARAQVQSANAQAALTEKEFQRIAALTESHVTSPSDLDKARGARDDAAAKAKAAVEQLHMVEAGTRRQQIAAAAHAAEAASAQVIASRSRVGELDLTAPVSGVVLLQNFRNGEYAGPGAAVVTLGNPDSLWMRVYVATPQMGRVKLGAPVEVRVIGMKQVFKGRVVEIATEAEFTPRAALTEDEQANLVFGVKVVLDPTGGVLKAGLPAEARIGASGTVASR